MKKWMALLLGCLLCWCAVGAMAEETAWLIVGDGYSNYAYDIYPNGYTITDDHGYTSRPISHTGRYVITGAIAGFYAPVEFHANMYDSELEDDQDVRYDVTFDGLDITSTMSGSPAISFFAGDQEKDAKNCSITLRLYNTGNSSVDGVFYPVFTNSSEPENNHTVEILVHNLSGKLELNGNLDQGSNGVVSQGITLAYDTDKGQVKIDGNNQNDSNHSTRLEITELSCKHHLKYSPTSATCTTAGKQGYYVCTICNRMYLNDDATGETTLWDLPAAGPLGHDLTHVDAVNPSCTKNGNIEHYRCTREGCGALFADAQGRNETTPEAVTIPAQHDLTLVPRKEPTYEQEGNIEHYRCMREGCGKLFADAEGKQELSPAEVILPMLVRTDDLPQTGDSSSLPGWAALLGACCAGLWCLNRRRG